jgi:hypothetical protein
VVSKAGFHAKRVSLVPNLPSPVFAVLQAERPHQPSALAGTAPQSTRALWAAAGRRARRSDDQPRRPVAAIDDDAILPLSSQK